MPAKAVGPLLEDYRRAIRAAKREGAAGVAVRIGKATIVIPNDPAYMDKLAQGQPPAPDVETGEKPKSLW